MNTHIFTTKVYGFLAIETRLCKRRVLNLKMRLQGSWDRQKIISKLQNMQNRGLPLHAHYMLKKPRSIGL